MVDGLRTSYRRLFLETFRKDVSQLMVPGNAIARPMYSLNSLTPSTQGLHSLYHIWINSPDEWSFVDIAFDGNRMLWEMILDAHWFDQPNHHNEQFIKSHRGIAAWREDMALRDASVARSRLLSKASEGDTSAIRKTYDSAVNELKKPMIGRKRRPGQTNTEMYQEQTTAHSSNVVALDDAISKLASKAK